MRSIRSSIAVFALVALSACSPSTPSDPAASDGTTSGASTPASSAPEPSTPETSASTNEEPTPTVDPIPALQAGIPHAFPEEFGDWITSAEITDTSRLYTDDRQRYYSVDHLKYADMGQAASLITDPAIEGQFLCGSNKAVDELVSCYTPTPGGVMQFAGKADEMSTDEIITHAHTFIDAWTGQ